MGAFDTYAAEARCPRCGDVHLVDGQTKFFVPDFFGLFHRHFRPWSPQPLDFSPAELATSRVWDDSWWRVREPGDPARLDLLVDFDELFGCDCGVMFAVVLRFRLAEGSPPSAMLTAIDLREVTTAAALAVDFAGGEALCWTGDMQSFRAAMAALAGQPAEARRDRLRAALAGRFPREVEAAEAGDPGPWSYVTAVVRCEACGSTRARSERTLLSHPDYPTSFFGPAWTGGLLAAGARLVGDLSWLAEDRDRGYYTRLRHPVPEDRLTVLARPRRTWCGCGAGPAALLLTLDREPGALVVREATLRAVRGPEDLADVDFAEAPQVTRDVSARAMPRAWEWTREEAVRVVLEGFRG